MCRIFVLVVSDDDHEQVAYQRSTVGEKRTVNNAAFNSNYILFLFLGVCGNMTAIWCAEVVYRRDGVSEGWCIEGALRG
jgi:hypothetical protein